MSEIGERIKCVRKSLKLTQSEFALKTGISNSFLSYVETGSKNPSFELLFSLSSKFAVKMDWVFTGKGEMFQSDELKTSSEIKDELFRLYSKLKDKELVFEFLDSLEAPIMYHAFMAWYLRLRREIKDDVDEFFSKGRSKDGAL